MNLKSKLLLLFFALSIVWIACRKTDTRPQENVTPSSPIKESRFFTEHRSTDPQVLEMTKWLQNKNEKENFVNKTIAQIGYPRWDKAMITSLTKRGYRGANDASLIIYVPFVRDTQNYVNASLIIKMEPSDSSYFFLCDWQYSQFGFSQSSDSTWNARDIFHLFASLDKSVFGTKSFIISDDRLFTSSTDTSRKTIVTLRNNQPTSGRNELFINITECDDIDVCFATEEEYQQLCGGSCTTGCQFYTHTEQECTTYSIYIPDGNNGNSNTGNGNTGGTTTGGGSGTSSGSPTPPPCDGPTTGSRTESNLPCTPGWTPVPVTNNLGYYYSRLNQLYDSLMSNPYFFINPCDYLNQFKAIGNFQVPNSIKNKLDTLNFLYYNLTMAPNFVNSPFYVRDINSAYGTVVNCDYFPVHINTLPTINGVQWTSQQLFDYFRRNKNSFLDTSIARFTPYIDFPYIVDTGWNNANPLGSLLHLNMINDGTVIVSDYYSTTDSSRYIVSTVNSPLDGIHPVSGNRVWGINIDAVNGGYNFYTSAVDRITNPFFDIFNDIGELTPIPSGFEQADNLWRSMQSNMINFINNNDGNATLYSGSNEIKVRPPWFILKEFFKGNVTLEQLKAVFGC